MSQSDFPETDKRTKDGIDLLVEAGYREEEIPNDQGIMERQLVIDKKQIWYETRIVNRPFGIFSSLLEDLEAKAKDCKNHMSKERAEVLSKQIMLKVDGFRKMIDSLSSQTYRNGMNNQQCLVDKVLRNRSERQITLKGEAVRSFKDMILGKEAQNERDNV